MQADRVVALHLKPESGGIAPVDALNAVAGKGFVGDKCFGRRHRQVLFISSTHLEELGFDPGQLREQVTVTLPTLQSLPVGTIVAVGDVEFEIEQDCEPCSRMAQMMGEEPEAFIARSSFKRGMLMKVRTSGTIRIGDEVKILGASA